MMPRYHPMCSGRVSISCSFILCIGLSARQICSRCRKSISRGQLLTFNLPCQEYVQSRFYAFLRKEASSWSCPLISSDCFVTRHAVDIAGGSSQFTRGVHDGRLILDRRCSLPPEHGGSSSFMFSILFCTLTSSLSLCHWCCSFHLILYSIRAPSIWMSSNWIPKHHVVHPLSTGQLHKPSCCQRGLKLQILCCQSISISVFL